MSEISPAEWTAILLSVRVAVIATLVATPFGIALAWLLARRDFWGKAILDAAIHLPLVLPPVVTGYLLLLNFGSLRPLAGTGSKPAGCRALAVVCDRDAAAGAARRAGRHGARLCQGDRRVRR